MSCKADKHLFTGPQTFNARESPRFRSAEITILGKVVHAKEWYPTDVELKSAGQSACLTWASFGGTIKIRITREL